MRPAHISFLSLVLINVCGLTGSLHAASDEEIVVSYGSRFKDPVGDGRVEDAPDYDIIGLAIQSNGLDTVTVTMKIKEPIAE